MGFIDVMKDVGQGALAGVGTRYPQIAADVGDTITTLDMQNNPPIAVDDTQPERFNNPILRDRTREKVMAAQKRLSDLAQAAAHADREESIRIGRQMDEIVRKKDYFSKLIEDAHDKTDAEFKDTPDDPGKDFARTKKIGVGYAQDPYLGKMGAGRALLGDAQDMAKRGAEAASDVWKWTEADKRKMPAQIEQKQKEAEIQTAEEEKRARTRQSIQDRAEQRREVMEDAPERIDRKRKRQTADAQAEFDRKADLYNRYQMLNEERVKQGKEPVPQEFFGFKKSDEKKQEQKKERDIYSEELNKKLAGQDAALLQDIPLWLEMGGIPNDSGTVLPFTGNQRQQWIDKYNKIAGKAGRETLPGGNAGSGAAQGDESRPQMVGQPIQDKDGNWIAQFSNGKYYRVKPKTQPGQ
jgi:hypothetical protein